MKFKQNTATCFLHLLMCYQVLNMPVDSVIGFIIWVQGFIGNK